jgi:proline racemase
MDMHHSRMIGTVDVHAAGEIGRIITSGVLPLPGATMAARMEYMNEGGAALRRFICAEPRGAAMMTTNLLQPSTRPDADAGFIPLQIDRAHAMSGSNAICVTTALLETGMVPITGPDTTVRLDTAAGLVVARASCRDGRCQSVALDMPPSYAHALDVTVTTDALGVVRGDVAFGGVFYLLVDAEPLGLTIEPGSARRLVDAGIAILEAANQQLDVRHKTIPELTGISYVMFRAWETGADGARVMRNATILMPGRVDRSPCGTGSSARLAVMVARGEARAGDAFAVRSVISSRFDAAIRAVNADGTIQPRISGSAWVYGTTQLFLDPTDPYPEGFVLSDTWGPGVRPA